jgi:hypothetical protein
MNNYLIKSIALALFFFWGCTKPGPGGKASIGGIVSYSGTSPATNIMVYIKYGATSMPGTQPSDYDGQVSADASGNYSFGSMEPGNYYLYATGITKDPYGYQLPVKGGAPGNIPGKKTKATCSFSVYK